jgi:hypothetical protein
LDLKTIVAPDEVKKMVFVHIIFSNKQLWYRQVFIKVLEPAMKISNKTKKSEVNPINNFDVLCQGFEGGSFYGLEYILEEFFQSSELISSPPAKSDIDWFGLYQ